VPFRADFLFSAAHRRGANSLSVPRVVDNVGGNLAAAILKQPIEKLLGCLLLGLGRGAHAPRVRHENIGVGIGGRTLDGGA